MSSIGAISMPCWAKTSQSNFMFLRDLQNARALRAAASAARARRRRQLARAGIAAAEEIAAPSPRGPAEYRRRARRHAERNADEIGLHRIERGGLGVDCDDAGLEGAALIQLCELFERRDRCDRRLRSHRRRRAASAARLGERRAPRPRRRVGAAALRRRGLRSARLARRPRRCDRASRRGRQRRDRARSRRRRRHRSRRAARDRREFHRLEKGDERLPLRRGRPRSSSGVSTVTSSTSVDELVR